MEQPEQKKKRTTETSLSSKSTLCLLPLDVISQILSKLPAKSLVRSRCVSKLWSSITTDSYFINSFKSWPKLLLFFREGDKFFVFSIPQHNQNRYESYTTCSSIDSYHVTYPKHCSFTIKTESVNGLICFKKSTNPVVWNPSTRTFLTLSKPEKSWKAILVLLGYDPIEDKHKVLCLHRDIRCDVCRVLTLGSAQQSWRTIKTSHMYRSIDGINLTGISTSIQGRCINGFLYFQALLDAKFVIMKFHVRSEKLDVIELPSCYRFVWFLNLIPYEGKLAFVVTSKDSIEMSVLEDAAKGKWSNHSFLPLSHYDMDLKSLKLVGITLEGELIYVPKTFLKSFHILYIDPKKKTLRRVEYRGIVDDDFRKRHGLEDRRLSGFQFFPNHIENLMSL